MKAEQAFYLNVITNKPFELLCEIHMQQKYLDVICQHLNTCNLTFQQSINSQRAVQWGNVEQTEYDELEGITDVYTHARARTHQHTRRHTHTRTHTQAHTQRNTDTHTNTHT